MADTLVPAVLNEVIARGDTYTATHDVLEGADADSAVAVALSGREYRMTVRHPSTGEVLAQITTTSSATGVITRDADSTTGRLRWRIDQSVTAGWPVNLPLPRDLEETNGGDVQTLFTGTITVREDQST